VRRSQRHGLTTCAMVLALAGGCTAAPTPALPSSTARTVASSTSSTPPADGFSPLPTPTTSTLQVAHDAAFELTERLDVPAAGFKSGDAISIQTTYRFLGPEASLIAGSAFPSLVYFSLEELDGPLDQAGGASRLMCHSVSLTRDALVEVPFQKTGAYSGTDPNASFWTGYFGDPALRLPAGLWRITAHLNASIRGADDPCIGEMHILAASVTFQVGE
jgi:hypothetical protein